MPDRGDGPSRLRHVVVAAALATFIAGCVNPDGRPVQHCGAPEPSELPGVAASGEGETRTVAIECYRRIGRERIELRFDLPAGPSCFGLARVELRESADAVTVTLHVSRRDDTSGACPPERPVTSTQVELQAPLGRRGLRDGSARP